MRKTRRGSTALLLMLWLVAAQAQPAPAISPPAADAVPVRAALVTLGTVTDIESFIGSLDPVRDAVIAAQTAGTITEVRVQSGQHVRQGDPLFQFDTRAARADIEVQEARVRVTQGSLRRAQELLRSGNMTQSRLDELNADYATAAAQLTAAQVRLDILTIRAPFDAKAGIVRLAPGTFVQLGDQLVRLTDDTHLVVDFRLPQSLLPRVGLGQHLAVSGNALGPGRVLQGQVTVIDAQADRNTRAVAVRGEVATDGMAMVSGIAVRVDLTVARRERRVIAPIEALMPGLVSDQVFQIEQGIARLVQVHTGARREGKVEVLSGLSEGDLVVTLGQFRIQDGARVVVVPEGEPSAVRATSTPPASMPTAGTGTR